MVRTMTLVLLAAAAAGAIGGCDGSRAGCSLSASGTITCTGETFDACAVAGCPAGATNCAIPPTGCQIAPGMVLAHYAEKPPSNDAYLCGDPLTICGTWSEASCAVTITNYLGGAPGASVSITYAIHDSTCP